MSRSRSRSPIRRSSSDRDRDRRDRADRRSSRIDQKSDRMVYLSNLPWELKWMELKDIIREKAGEVNFVEVLEDRDGRSKGCAVVEFKHREGADKCIENMHRTELRDRMIVAKEIRDPIAFFRKVKEDTGIDFLGGGDRLERSRSNVDRNSSGSSITINENETFGLSPNFLRQLGIGTPLCNRIFITNIPYNIGVGRLYDICALAGKVTWFDLQMDKEGKSKGMAVCEYSHPIEAVQAVSMLNNQRLLDRTMAIRMDRYPKDSDRHREPNGLPFGLRGVGMGLGANGAPLTDVASVLSTIAPTAAVTPQIGMNGGASSTPFATPAPMPVSQSQQQSSWISPSQQPSQIIIQPTPTMVQQTPQTNFTQNAQQEHGGHFQPPPSQTSYQAHTTGGFFNPPAAVQPSSVPRQTPGVPQFGGAGGGQYQPKSAQSYVPQQANAPQSHAGTVKYEISTPKYDFGNVGGYGSSVSQSGGSMGASLSGGSGNYDTSRVILIKNLPVDYTWQIVSDRVQQFGELESVEMITPGVAKVRFMQLKDAERAKNSLQGTTVEGRAIGIEYL